MENFGNENVKTRPPVVVVMGHVDHGKTTILDTIRKTKVAEKEAGGITQHMGAYEVEHQGKKITFLDTPGHEAFYAMRSRGVKVADIAVLVVAADDGVMPQTKEAIKHITQAGIPMIVAINKIDKPGANPQRVKNQLLEEQIVIEEFKGNVPCVEVSARTGQGIDSLLEMINLVAEVAELKARSIGNAEGAVIEAELNPKSGPSATLLVKEGVLSLGDIVATSSSFGKIKRLENFLGESLEAAQPGMPVRVTGLGGVPGVGEKFSVHGSVEEASAKVVESHRKTGEGREVLEVSPNEKVLPLILKADAHGTLEAVRGVMKSITQEGLFLRILSEGVGEIMETDIKFAASAKALIVGFRVKINHAAVNFAQQTKVEVLSSDVIYDLVEKVRAKVNELSVQEEQEVELGTLKTMAIFRTEKTRMIIGGKVLEGKMKRGAKVRVLRGESVEGEGKIASLKIQDKSVEEAQKGTECGILFEGHVRIQVGDTLQAYEVTKKKHVETH
jgi:translation initiation factor IF-2